MSRDQGYATSTETDGNPFTRRDSVHSGSSTESPHDEESVSCGQNLWGHGGLAIAAADKFLTEYKTHPTVVVRSRSLCLAHLITLIVFFGGLVFYQVYTLSFLQKVPVHAEVNVILFPPMANYWSCTDIDIDCKPMAFTKEMMDNFHYCKDRQYQLKKGGGMLNTSENHVRGCRYGRPREVFEKSSGDRVLTVATAVSEFTETIRQSPTEIKTVVDRNASTWYITGIEDWLLSVNFKVFEDELQCEDACDARAIPGLVWSQQNQSYQSIPFAEYDAKHGATLSQSGLHSPPCGGLGLTLSNLTLSNGEGRYTCVRNEYGIKLSIGRVLELANLTLDDFHKAGPPHRLYGSKLRMSIRFRNSDDFWSWPWGLKNKYYIQFHQIYLAGNNGDDVVDQQWHKHTEFDRFDPQAVRFESISRRGLTVESHWNGEVSVVSFNHFVLSLLVSMTALGFANLVVNVAVVRLFRYFPATRGAAAAFRYYARQESPHDYEFDSAMSKKDTSEIHSLVERHKFNRLRDATKLEADFLVVDVTS